MIKTEEIKWLNEKISS